MAVIVIKDLTDSVELDRDAMSAIVGGARTAGGSHAWHLLRHNRQARLIQYPGGFPGTQPAGTAQKGRAKKVV